MSTSGLASCCDVMAACRAQRVALCHGPLAQPFLFSCLAEALGKCSASLAKMQRAVSTSVFIVAILILLLLLYHRDPMCCQFLCSCRFFQTPSQYDCPPPYFSSSQRLVGPQRGATRLESAAENPGVQGDELFCVGPPSTYQLPSWEQPRLPSYESVRKKDRQREIHQMIAERFGLWAEPSQEMPPPYEHALRHPPALSGTLISSGTLNRRGVPEPFQAPLSYPAQRNTDVERPNLRPTPRFTIS
ncbi:xylosyltransferase 2 isoform C [Patagioenas fasciata monilis]|nr:xylosyltransferase 2 isoform C [Patagioenas fasciata monilis]